jgi:hypothetical protein
MKKILYLLLFVITVQSNLNAIGTAPASVSLTITGTSWSASWSNTGDPMYYLMITTSTSFPGWSGGLGTNGSTSFSGSGLSAGSTYYVYVTGVDGGYGWATTTRSNGATASNPCSATNSPGWASGTSSGLYSADFTWGTSGGTSPINYYWNVYTSGGSLVTGSNTTGTSASTSSLNPNSLYYVTVYANNCGGSSSTVQSGNFATFTSDPPSISASSNPVCSGISTTLTCNGAVGTVYWYTGSCGGTQVATGNTYTVSPSSTTVYYARNYNNSQFSAGCATLTVTVTSRPTVADLNTTGTDIKWYDAAAGGNFLPLTTVLVNGQHYYASQTINGCESTARFEVTVTLQ